MIPTLISGGRHKDHRGVIRYNNAYDATLVKRIYIIENAAINFERRWQGHRIEQRWFTTISGIFIIRLIKIDNWESPSKELDKITFEISDENADVLHVPAGYVSSIQGLTNKSKLLVMADYRLNEINDEYKFSPDYFKD